LRGRHFGSQDSEDKPRVVIVNESFERRHLGGEGAIGKRLSLGGTRGPWHEVIGVVRDSKYVTVGETPTSMAYLPLQQNHETGVTLLVRAAGDPVSLVAAVSSAIACTSRIWRPQNSAICSNVSDVFSTSHEAVAWGIRGWATGNLRISNKMGRPFPERPTWRAM